MCPVRSVTYVSGNGSFKPIKQLRQLPVQPQLSGLSSLGSIEANETGTPKPTPHILAERHVVFDLVVVSGHALGAPTKPEVKNTLWTPLDSWYGF